MLQILGVDYVRVLSSDLDDSIERWTRQLGLACERASTAAGLVWASLPIGEVDLQILESHDPLRHGHAEAAEGLLSLGLRVAELDRCVATLRERGLGVEEPGPDPLQDRLSARVPPHEALGLTIELVEDLAREPRNTRGPELEHIAIIVPDVGSALALYREVLGLPVHSQARMEDFVVALFFATCGGTELEIVEPLSEQSSVYPYVRRPPDGLHHLCFRTDDIHGVLADLERKHVPLIHHEVQDHGSACFFVAPEAHRGVVVEFLQP